MNCKNLFSYNVNITNEVYRDEYVPKYDEEFMEKNKRPDGKTPEKGFDVFLHKEKVKLPGGATFAMSIFREKNEFKAKMFPKEVNNTKSFGRF